jgi:hypothetical protein
LDSSIYDFLGRCPRLGIKVAPLALKLIQHLKRSAIIDKRINSPPKRLLLPMRQSNRAEQIRFKKTSSVHMIKTQ